MRQLHRLDRPRCAGCDRPIVSVRQKKYCSNACRHDREMHLRRLKYQAAKEARHG